MASGRKKGTKKNMTFFCVVENVVGGVISHPAVINLLAVRHTGIEVEMWGRTVEGNKLKDGKAVEVRGTD